MLLHSVSPLPWQQFWSSCSSFPACSCSCCIHRILAAGHPSSGHHRSRAGHFSLEEGWCGTLSRERPSQPRVVSLSLFGLVLCCYISVLVLTCFWLRKGRATFFDPKQLLRVSYILWYYFTKWYSTTGLMCNSNWNISVNRYIWNFSSAMDENYFLFMSSYIIKNVFKLRKRLSQQMFL